MRAKFAVGDVVYLTGARVRGPGHHARIATIGRRWATLEGPHNPDRFDISEDRGDGPYPVDAGKNTSRTSVWRTLEAYDEARRRDAIWQSLTDFVRGTYRAPAHLTGDALARILAELSGHAP